MEDRSLKSACQNGMVLSVVLLSDEVNYRLVRSILAVSSVVKSWHAEQVAELRSCERFVLFWLLSLLFSTRVLFLFIFRYRCIHIHAGRHKL